MDGPRQDEARVDRETKREKKYGHERNTIFFVFGR